jgi:hypothetical protein
MKKIFSLAVEGYENIFALAQQHSLFCSTYFRMNYLSKPITGLINKTDNFFQDGSFYLALAQGWTSYAQLLFVTFNSSNSIGLRFRGWTLKMSSPSPSPKVSFRHISYDTDR